MNKEIEVKAKIKSVKEITTKLKKLGGYNRPNIYFLEAESDEDDEF